MGPAILLCPSGTVQFLCEFTLLKTNRQKASLSANESARHLLYPHLKGDFFRRSTHLFSSNALLKSRKNYVPFAWRVSTASMGGEVSVEEPITETGVEKDFSQEDRASKGEDSSASDTSEVTQTRLQRTAIRRDRNIVVSNDALKPGATFTGNVTGIQSFGAFVNFGAFTNGLIHISRLRRSFVKSVEDVVQVGQEVRVQILDVDFEKSRISLMLVRDDGKEEEDPVRRPRVHEIDGRQKAARRGSLGRRLSERMNERISDPVEPATSSVLEGLTKKQEVDLLKDVVQVPANPIQTSFSQKEETASTSQKKKTGEVADFVYLPFLPNEGLAAYLRRMNKIRAEKQARLSSSEEKKTDSPSESEGGEAPAVGVAEKQFEGWIDGFPIADIIDTPRAKVFVGIEQAVKKEVVDKLQEDDLLVAMSLAAEEETVKKVVQEDGLSVVLN